MNLFLLLLGCTSPAADFDIPTFETATPPSPVPPTPTPTPRIPTERRHDCAGLDPADAAPLGGKVTLTFDDGPHPSVTPAILEILRTENIPATFFMVGSVLENPDLWPIAEEIVLDPLFTLGNHGWTHSNLVSMSTADQDAEIDDTTGLLETFGPVDFLRFPFGSSDCPMSDRVRDRGLALSGWHVDTVDWCYGADGSCTPSDYSRVPPEYSNDMLGFTMEQLERFDGGIVLMHDIHSSTAAALPELISRIRAAGFAFTSLDDATAWPALNANQPDDLPFLGETCDPQNDACWQVEYSSWCDPVGDGTHGICVLPCEGTCWDRPGAPVTFCQAVSTGAGECVGRAGPRNDWCSWLPGTEELEADRYVGSSGAAALTLDICR